MSGLFKEAREGEIDQRQVVARERLRRSLMAAKSRSGYKFKDPEKISAKYAKPSPLDQGQPLHGSPVSPVQKRPKPFAGNRPK